MLTFQQKMLVAFLLLVLLPIIITGVVSYQLSSSTLQKEISRQTVQTLKLVDRNLHASISEVDSYTDYVISSGEIQSYLKNNENISSIYEFYNKQQAIAGIMYGNSQIDDFILYRVNGDVFHIKNTTIPSLSKLKASPFFQKMQTEKGGSIWLTPLENRSFYDREATFLTLSRIVKDINTLEDLGYLFVNIKIDLFDNIFGNIHEDDSNQMIIDSDGRVLYALNHKLIGETLDRQVMTNIKADNKGYLLEQWNGEENLITYLPTSFESGTASDLMLVSVQPWKGLSSDIAHIRNLTIIIVTVCILIAILFNMLYLKRIALFVQEFLLKMREVEDGKLTSRMREFRLRDLNHISQGFNRMINRIQELLTEIKMEQERKREAQFQVLQHQINPHFLYNTLESINALATMNGQKGISKMTINLGKLLRISINGGYDVKVNDEIRHVISYLEIQKVRFDNQFSYEVNIDKELEEYRVLKLILQPLVENILKHAFKQDKPGHIVINGSVIDGKGSFWIKDNGRGIEPNILKELNEMQTRRPSKKNGGHGIRNVHERLRLYYGIDYGIIICSSSNEGTVIKLSFPTEGDSNAL